jgi:creatine kinase
MSHDEEEALRKAGNLFQEPDSTLLLSSGCGRHWPDARGIFHNEARNFFVWINEEDHSRIISMEKGDNVHAIFNRFAKATTVIADTLKSMGKDFMHNDHLGYILTCPSNLGTGLRAGCMVKIPLVSARKDFKDLCAKLCLQARGGGGVDSVAEGGKFDISNADRLGKSETTLVNIFIEGVANFVRWEAMLEKKEDIEAEIAAAKPGVPSKAPADYPPAGLSANVKTLPEWIQLGCGDMEYNCPEKGATFLAEAMPAELPDLKEHANYLTDVLKKDPSLYGKLKDKKTKLGVNLGHCIKTGIDNKGHPMIKTCGLVAGDEESWELFKDVMDPVVSARHGGYAPDAKHPTDMNPANLSKRKIDPTGKYVLTTRCRTGRSVRGFRLPPCNSF